MHFFLSSAANTYSNSCIVTVRIWRGKNENTRIPATFNLINKYPKNPCVVSVQKPTHPLLAKPALSVTFRNLSACPSSHLLTQQIDEEKVSISSRKMYFFLAEEMVRVIELPWRHCQQWQDIRGFVKCQQWGSLLRYDSKKTWHLFWW